MNKHAVYEVHTSQCQPGSLGITLQYKSDLWNWSSWPNSLLWIASRSCWPWGRHSFLPVRLWQYTSSHCYKHWRSQDDWVCWGSKTQTPWLSGRQTETKTDTASCLPLQTAGGGGHQGRECGRQPGPAALRMTMLGRKEGDKGNCQNTKSLFAASLRMNLILLTVIYYVQGKRYFAVWPDCELHHVESWRQLPFNWKVISLMA